MVLWAGNPWQGLPATDHHLARALAQSVDVLWVDPTEPLHHGRSPLPRTEQVAEGIRVLALGTVPGAARSGLRQLAEAHLRAALTVAQARESRRVWATISCSPRAQLPTRGGGVTVLHATDDWLAGAAMMGLDQAWLERVLRSNVRTADVVSAVSVDLAQTLQRMNPRHMVEVVPNGAIVPDRLLVGERSRTAVLVGQLNERLDLAMLEAVLDAGVELRVIGPRAEREPEVTRRLDQLLARPGVDYRGLVPHEQVVDLLGSAAVGVTPYAINEFNKASFPLKTLEYLANGLPVVSTRMESLDWLATDLVDVADSPQQFGELVRRRADEPRDAALEERRRALADRHSWSARAEALLQAIARRA
ncbi:hypothetical protein GCM10009599_05740 [Luteococcus peritonei]